MAALALMNDEQFVEASRALAQRTMQEGGQTNQQRASYIFRLVTARAPASAELEVLVDMYEDNLKKYETDKDSASKLIHVGESKPNESLNPSQLAAWTMVGNLVLNLDETVTKN